MRVFARLIPIPMVNIAPHRVCSYWQYEGLEKGRKKGIPKLATGAEPSRGFIEIPERVYPVDAGPELLAELKSLYDEGEAPIHAHNNSLQNLLQNKTETISVSAKKRIINSVNYMYVLSKEKQYTFTATKGKYTGKRRNGTFRINMVTLTLCAKQMHSDKFVKAEMLDYFLERLRKNHGMKSYMWRAERQKNGRIHFHVITNIFLPHEKVRKYWNDVQLKYGYIAAYIATGGDNNPNGTDIHSVQKVRKMAAYVCKYLAKEPDLDKDGKPLLKPIEGRQWFLSQNLSRIKPITKIFEADLRKELEAFVNGKWRECSYAYVAYADIFGGDLAHYPLLSGLKEGFLFEYSSSVN